MRHLTHKKVAQNARTFVREYVWLGARPIAQIERKIRANGTVRAAKITYIHADHLNTPRRATNEQGETVWRWAGDAFGAGQANRDVDGDGKNTVIRLRFPGQYYDHESGLYYNHNRDYDPKLGRYIQSDPIGLKGGINRYAYVGGNPVNFVDPSGRAAVVGGTGCYGDTNTTDSGCVVTAKACPDGWTCSGGGGPGGYGGSSGSGGSGGSGGGGGNSGGSPQNGPANDCDLIISNNELYQMFDFNPNGLPETQLGIFAAINSGAVLDMATNAQLVAASLYPNNNTRDAFRHTYWSYSLTSVFGPQLAKTFTDAHEVTGNNNGQPIGELYMDLYNNFVGRTLFEIHRNTNFAGADVKNLIVNAINSNEIITQVPTICGN